ncbi:hypothetical protein SNEBB_004395 [Seison nebaliae]|nr:hypothetical protein SNEBB_004395 [Seison nebaliae]
MDIDGQTNSFDDILKEFEIEPQLNLKNGAFLSLTSPNSRAKSIAQKIASFWPCPFRSPLVWLDIIRLVRLVNRMAIEVPVTAPWNSPNANLWDRQTVHDFAQRYLWTRHGRRLLHSIVNRVGGVDPWDASLLWFIWISRQLGGLGRLFHSTLTIGDSDRSHIPISSIDFANLLNKNCRKVIGSVARVLYENYQYKILLNDNDLVIHCEHVILSNSLESQSKIMFRPNLPMERMQLMQRVPGPSVLIALVAYHRCFWKEMGCSGFGRIDRHDLAVSWISDASLPNAKKNGKSIYVLRAMVFTEKSIELMRRSSDDRKAAILHSINALFDTDAALEVVMYDERYWANRPWIGAVHGEYFAPGVLTKYAKYLRRPHNNIHFSGNATAIRGYGKLEGAITSGERSAREILFNMGLITASELENSNIDELTELLTDAATARRRFESNDLKQLNWLERNVPSIPTLLITSYATTVFSLALLSAYLIRKSFL